MKEQFGDKGSSVLGEGLIREIAHTHIEISIPQKHSRETFERSQKQTEIAHAHTQRQAAVHRGTGSMQYTEVVHRAQHAEAVHRALQEIVE